MAVKGFYFSLDAILGLAVIGLAASLVTVGVNTGLSGDQIRFSSYSGQAVDIGYLMQKQDLEDLNSSQRSNLLSNTAFENRDLNRSVINGVLVLEEEGDSYSEQLAGDYLGEFDYSSGLYYRNGSGLETVVELDAEVVSSASITATGDERPYEVTVVVGK